MESGWKDGPAGSFDHGRTRFVLRDAHRTVSCAHCHGDMERPGSAPPLRERPIVYACDDCHADVHAGQFAGSGGRTGCDRCHAERSFLPPHYGPPEHERSSFPLRGAHQAVGCRECHTDMRVNGKTVRRFRWERTPACEDCHRDVHDGRFERFARGGCKECHTTSSWSEVRFAHDRTAFRLTGKHTGVACYRCHTPEGRRLPLSRWRFKDTPQQCVACHGRDVRPL